MAIIIPGPTRFPEGGGMAPASSERGINILDAVGHGATAKSIEITAEGPVAVFLNGEEIKAYSTNGDIRKFFHKGECQVPGGQKCGTIETLEVVGSGRFNLIVD